MRLTGRVNLSSLWGGDPLGPVGSVPCLATQNSTSAEVTCKNSARLSRLAHSEASLAGELIGADWHWPAVAESGAESGTAET